MNQDPSQDSSSEQGIPISQDGKGNAIHITQDGSHPGIWIIPWDYKELNELEW